MYVNQRMWYSQNDPVLGWDPFSVMLVGSTFSSSGGASGGSQQSATITYSSGGFEKVNFDPILNISPVSMSVAMAIAAQAMQTTSGPAIPPPKNRNTNPNLPTPTIFKLTIPGTNYCGPGGNGVPTDRVDAACAKHDRCYENAGVSFVNNLGWPKTVQQTAAIKACDANLSNDLMHIYFPTPAEAGQATIVSTYFNLPSGYNLRP